LSSSSGIRTTAGADLDASRRPYYRGSRPRRLAAAQIKVNQDVQASYDEVRTNRADQTLDLPRSVLGEVGREFGLAGRFRVRPSKCVSYIEMNTRNPLFRHNAQLRRAVNYALDRRAMVALDGPHASVPTDQYLPSGIAGFRDIKAYPFVPDLAKAKRLAAGRIPRGGPWIYYYGLDTPGPQRMELVRASLRQIGIEIEPRGFRGFAIYDAAGKRNSPHAFTTTSRCSDYPDPYSFLNSLVAYFDDASYNRRLERAEARFGDGRRRAYQALEHDLITRAAPWAAWGQTTKQMFFSDRVDQRSFVYQPVYETPVYNVLALK
jgi:ABC-type oligopeptide transport system substrate-binding subunit